MSANSQKKPFDRDFSLSDDDPLAELTRIIGLDTSPQDEAPADEPLEASLADMLDSSLGDDLDAAPVAEDLSSSERPDIAEDSAAPVEDEQVVGEVDFDLTELDDLDYGEAPTDGAAEEYVVADELAVTDEIVPSEESASYDTHSVDEFGTDPEALVAASLDEQFPIGDQVFEEGPDEVSGSVLDEADLAAIMSDEPTVDEVSASTIEMDASSAEADASVADLSADDGLAAFGLTDESLASADSDQLDVELDAADLAMAEFDEESFFDDASLQAAPAHDAPDALMELDEDSFADAFDAALREDLGDQAESVQQNDDAMVLPDAAADVPGADDSIRDALDDDLSIDEAVLMEEEAALIDETGELTDILSGDENETGPLFTDTDDSDAQQGAHEPVAPDTDFHDEAVFAEAVAISPARSWLDANDPAIDRQDDPALADDQFVTAETPFEPADETGDDGIVPAAQNFAGLGDRDVPDIETRVYDEAVVPMTDPLDIPDVSPAETKGAADFQDDALAEEFADILRAEGMASHLSEPAPFRDEDATVSADAEQDDATGEPFFGDAGQPDDYASDPSFDVSQLSPAAPPANAEGAFDDGDARVGYIPPERGSLLSRYGLYGGAALLALLVAGGGYAYFSGDDGDTEVAIIRADDEPVKVRPAETATATATADSQENEVYETVEGRASDRPQQNELVDTTETPLEIGSKDETRIAAQDPEAPARSDVVLIEPRKVRTFIVKPDGSIVPRGSSTGATTAAVSTGTTGSSSPTSAAGQPANASAETFAPDRAVAAAATPIGAAGPNDAESPGANDLALAPASGDETTGALAASATEAAATDAVEADPDVAPLAEQIVDIPLPLSRPDVGRVTPRQTAAAPATSTNEPAETATAGVTPQASTAAPPAWVQISSHPTREAAQVSYRAMSQRYNSLLAGRGVNIVPAEISGRGTYYRVNISASSFADATALCGQIKSAGGDCLARR